MRRTCACVVPVEVLANVLSGGGAAWMCTCAGSCWVAGAAHLGKESAVADAQRASHTVICQCSLLARLGETHILASLALLAWAELQTPALMKVQHSPTQTLSVQHDLCQAYSMGLHVCLPARVCCRCSRCWTCCKPLLQRGARRCHRCACSCAPRAHVLTQRLCRITLPHAQPHLPARC